MSEISVIGLVSGQTVTAIYAKEIRAEDAMEFLVQNYSNPALIKELISKGHVLVLGKTPETSIPASAKPNTVQAKIEELAQRLFGTIGSIYIYDETASQTREALTARGRDYDKIQSEGAWTEYQNLTLLFSEGTGQIAA